MTNTSTTELAAALGAKRAELQTAVVMAAGEHGATNEQIVGVARAVAATEVIPPADPQTGEIVGAAPSQEGTGGPSESPNLPVPTGGGAAPAETEPLGSRTDSSVPIPYPTIAPKVIGGLPYASQYARLAKTIANTEMVPGAMRGRYDAVTAAFMRGYEMGLGPMQALDSFHVIDGKVGLTAEAMRALIIQDGHQIRLSDVYNGDEFVATVAKCHRKDWEDGDWEEYRFSLEDADKAGLLRPSRSGKPSNWMTYPRAMCDARATSGAGRRYFPDVLAGMSYTPEEIRDFDGPAEAQEAPPSPTVQEPTAPPAPPAPPITTGDQGATTEPVDSAPPDAVPPSSPQSSTPDPPKKRGRPKKETPPETVTSGATESATTEPGAQPLDSATPSPSEDSGGGVTAAMISGLTEIIKGLPSTQQPLCRAFINQHFPQRAINTLTQVEIQKCIDIAAGFPDSMTQHPLPEDGQNQLGI